jgi:ADP-dependent NAD(P)H-hydrate dehydratase / NAD(P)H-hydrate epimerase
MTPITKDSAVGKLSKRPGDANKGTFGKALIIAGSKNYPGAAILSVLACARSGVGLVTLATIPEVYKVAVPKIPFATFLEFSEIEKNWKKYDSVLIGPGLGQSDDMRLMIKQSLPKDKKIVLDADALNILSEDEDWYKTLRVDAILTPHPGEMSRLTKLSINEIQTNRGKVALDFAKKWKKTIVLKGAETVIANPEGKIYKASFANPLLATAGTGDILSGIITGLLAQGLDLTDAAIAGVFIHGTAAEKLKEKFGDRGMTAIDLVEKLPEVFKEILQKSV